MKITSFEVRCVNVEMAPHRTASGVITVSPLVLLTLGTDAGVKGHSMTFTYTSAALKPTADLIKNLESLVIGQELAPGAQTDSLAARFRLLGTQGLVGMALAGIDMALWDAFARAHALPLVALLGGAPRPIPAYGGVGYDGVDGSARAAEAWARAGLRGVKAKIGYATLQEDLAVVRAIKAAVGPGVAVMVDYNQSLTPTEAARRLRALDAEGLEWIEEPVLAHDYAALASLASTLDTPLQAGENWWGPLDFRHAFESGVRDHCMPDVMKVGGVTGWMRVASMSQALGVPVSNHLWPEISAQLLMATPTAAWLEYADWWNPILLRPLELKDGQARVADDTVGTGVEFDDAAVAKYAA
ncbi:mandelate racemase [Ramlibacter ginsenosidimutans]|uniref:Mandelate racemase n=1 Tax=Ramlibacter ginsenosidimutans TaxID=502333 RepID=A0A934TSJ0_9BURK|nr:enolase C-terminal domain-like protein [Ramlibacter ginsenosidimutans]MBK6006608.1 mandelate racemase [Ramlibacter ginsenosidimutans]